MRAACQLQRETFTPRLGHESRRLLGLRPRLFGRIGSQGPGIGGSLFGIGKGLGTRVHRFGSKVWGLG